MHSFLYFIFAIVVFIVAFTLLKKIAGCLIKTVIFVIIGIILLAIYLTCFSA